MQKFIFLLLCLVQVSQVICEDISKQLESCQTQAKEDCKNDATVTDKNVCESSNIFCQENYDVTIQCQSDEVSNCEDNKCKDNLKLTEEVYEPFYEQCLNNMKTNKYQQCLIGKITDYLKNKDANQDLIQQFANRIVCYANAVCQEQAKNDCGADCENQFNILNECTVQKCTDKKDNLYDLRNCYLEKKNDCDVSSLKEEKNTQKIDLFNKLFNNIMTCLFYYRVTIQCQADEVFTCNGNEQCTDTLRDVEKGYQPFYESCLDKLITNEYQECLEKQVKNYSEDKNPNQDVVDQSANRIACYTSASRSKKCYQDQSGMCEKSKYYNDELKTKYKDKVIDQDDCKYYLQVFNGCLDQSCQIEQSSSNQFGCVLDHYEKCSKGNKDFNEIVKDTIKSCIYGIKLQIYTIFVLIFTYFFLF